MIRLYAQYLKGSRAKGKKPNKNVSIIEAISVNEALTSVNLISGTDAITFEALIVRKLVPKLWKGAYGIIRALLQSQALCFQRVESLYFEV